MRLRATRLTAVAHAASRLLGAAPAWSPLSWFASSEQGAWYDPTDLTRYMSVATSAELVTNGGFDSATGWNLSGSWTISGGVATNGGTGGNASQTASASMQGRWVLVTFSITAYTSGSVAPFFSQSTPTSVTVLGAYRSGIGTYSEALLVPANASTLGFNTSALVGSIDNVSVKEIPLIATATMYQDSAGVTPVTAVEQPVGLILDRRLGLALGPELVTNAADREFSSDTGFWAREGSSTISGGVVNINNPTGTAAIYRFNYPNEAGGYYEIAFDLVLTAGAVEVLFGASAVTGAITTSGRKVIRAYRPTVGTFGIRTIGATTATGTIDNITIKRVLGNHAFQATSTARPTLRNRYNLLTFTEQFDNAAWIKSGVSITPNAATAPDGTLTAALIGGAGGFVYQTRGGLPNPLPNTKSVWMRSVSGTVNVTLRDPQQTIGDLPCSLTTTWARFSLSETQTAGGAGLWIRDIPAAGIYVWGASLTTAADASLPYQRVTTATDYDSDPAKFPLYLAFDGSDDAMATSAIDFSARDEMTVVAGVTKLSDAASAVVVELSANASSNNGSFWLLAPLGAATNYNYASRGSSLASATASPYAAPNKVVVSGASDVSASSCLIRVQGVQVGSDAASQGSGNYGTHALNIGRRAASSLSFNGRLHQLIIRGAASADIAQAEAFVAAITGITL